MKFIEPCLRCYLGRCPYFTLAPSILNKSCTATGRPARDVSDPLKQESLHSSDFRSSALGAAPRSSLHRVPMKLGLRPPDRGLSGPCTMCSMEDVAMRQTLCPLASCRDLRCGSSACPSAGVAITLLARLGPWHRHLFTPGNRRQALMLQVRGRSGVGAPTRSRHAPA